MNLEKYLISTTKLQKLINDSRLIMLDCSWYLPSQKRDSRNEFNECHIPRARFFDIDLISDQESNLPHMIPTAQYFQSEVEKLGISNSSNIVVYDGMGVFSAARVWWMFHLFGHNNIRVLNGGFPKWQNDGYPTTSKSTEITNGNFIPGINRSMTVEMLEMKSNCVSNDSIVLDARPRSRFLGEAPEPRAGLTSGHIPGSISLPFTDLLNGNEMKSTEELRAIFTEVGANSTQPVITSCGSGVTAAIVSLAMACAGLGKQRLYDGSWAEWASYPDNPVSHGMEN